MHDRYHLTRKSCTAYVEDNLTLGQMTSFFVAHWTTGVRSGEAEPTAPNERRLVIMSVSLRLSYAGAAAGQ